MTSPTPPDVAGISLPREARPVLQSLHDLFNRRGVAAYLVGGFLRDVLLGRPTADIDLAVRGDAVPLAKEMADHLGGTFVLLDEARSTARMVLPRRRPLQGSGDPGPHWNVDMASFSGDIEQDLAGRDFTIDALALSLADALPETPGMEGGRQPVKAATGLGLLDPFGGLDDLSKGRVKVVSDHVFIDDPVRLLRAVRLTARLGFSLEQGAYSLIERDSHLLPTVAPERLRDELLKTLAEPEASRNMRLMDSLGLLCRLIPELEAARGVEQPKEHYWDVFYHCLETPTHVERLTTREGREGDSTISHAPWRPSLEAHFDEEVSDGHTRRTLVKLAGLLHDIAKPATRTIEPTGRMRFFGHDAQGAEMCQDILRRLRLSSRGVNLISTMVRHHLRPTQMRQGVDMPTPRAIYRYFRDLGEAAIDTLYLNMADYLAAKGPSIETDDWQGHCRLIGHIMQGGLDGEGAPRKAERLVDGHLLMETLGLPPGALVGRLLEAIQEAHGAGEVATQQEALALARRLMDPPQPQGDSR